MTPPIAAPADLHLHSDRSDGTEAPSLVLESAWRAGVRTAALTDHDTTAGWGEAIEAARGLGMSLLPGAEVSARHRGASVHILAYLFDPDASRLRALMDRVRGDRVARAERFVERLAREFPITWADVLARRAGDATVGRPHIADALVAAGLMRDRDEAFAGPLHPASPHYVPHFAPTPLDVVRAIDDAGGVSVIAHPAGRGMLPDSALRELIDAGLGGLELDHRENTVQGRAHLAAIAADADLIVTGSSDYHGAGKPNLPGEHTTAPAMVERILRRATGTAPVLA